MTISGAVLSLKNPSRFESLRCDSPCASHIFASRVSVLRVMCMRSYKYQSFIALSLSLSLSLSPPEATFV